MLFEYITEVLGSQSYFESQKVEAGDAIVLEREPTNKYDYNAIKVLWCKKTIGYINKKLAAEISFRLNDEVYLQAECISSNPFSIVIKVQGYLLV